MMSGAHRRRVLPGLPVNRGGAWVDTRPFDLPSANGRRRTASPRSGRVRSAAVPCMPLPGAGIRREVRETGDLRGERGPARRRRRVAGNRGDGRGRRKGGSAPARAGKHEQGATANEIWTLREDEGIARPFPGAPARTGSRRHDVAVGPRGGGRWTARATPPVRTSAPVTGSPPARGVSRRARFPGAGAVAASVHGRGQCRRCSPLPGRPPGTCRRSSSGRMGGPEDPPGGRPAGRAGVPPRRDRPRRAVRRGAPGVSPLLLLEGARCAFRDPEPVPCGAWGNVALPGSGRSGPQPSRWRRWRAGAGRT